MFWRSKNYNKPSDCITSKTSWLRSRIDSWIWDHGPQWVRTTWVLSHLVINVSPGQTTDKNNGSPFLMKGPSSGVCGGCLLHLFPRFQHMLEVTELPRKWSHLIWEKLHLWGFARKERISTLPTSFSHILSNTSSHLHFEESSLHNLSFICYAISDWVKITTKKVTITVYSF